MFALTSHRMQVNKQLAVDCVRLDIICGYNLDLTSVIFMSFTR